MNIVKRALAISAIVLTSFTASASLINVGGVEWDPDYGLDLKGASVVVYQEFNKFTGELSGFGRLTSLNGLDSATLCPGCELTFHFDNYFINDPDPFDGFDLFSGGHMEFWVDKTPDAPTSDHLALTFANTGDGDIGDGPVNALWLELSGHNYSGTTTSFIGTGNASGLTGGGLLDVIGGLAMGNIDTDSIELLDGTTADIRFKSEFSTFFDTETKLFGYGTASFNGKSIPEPGTLGIFALGLIALAIGVRTKKV